MFYISKEPARYYNSKCSLGKPEVRNLFEKFIWLQWESWMIRIVIVGRQSDGLGRKHFVEEQTSVESKSQNLIVKSHKHLDSTALTLTTSIT